MIHLFRPSARLLSRRVIVAPYLLFSTATAFGVLMIGNFGEDEIAFMSELVDGKPWSSSGWRDLWRLSIAIPFVLSFVPLGSVGEFIVGRYTWSIPDVRRRLAPGAAIAFIVPACVVPLVLVARMELAAAAGTLATGLVATSILLVLVAAKHKNIAVTVGVALLAGAGSQAGKLGDLAVAHPSLFLTATAIALSAMLAFCLSPASIRRAFADDHWWRLPTERRRRWQRIWRHSLVVAPVFQWIRAGEYEVFGEKWLGFYRGAAERALLFAFLMSVVNNDGALIAPVMAALGGVTEPPLLRRRVLYPMSRHRKAVIAQASVAAAVIASWLIGLGAMLLLDLTSLVDIDVRKVLGLTLVMLPFYPIMAYVRIRYGWFEDPTRFPSWKPFMLAMLVWLVLSAGTVKLFKAIDDPLTLTVFASVVVVTPQVFLWFRLRRFYETADLA